MKIESKYKLRTVKNGKPFYGEVILKMGLLSNSIEHELIEEYRGKGFQSQGYIESIPQKGYDSWKEGVRIGVDYALSMVSDNRKFKITILEANGLTTDTNPIILAFVASRAILNEVKNKESEVELKKIEEIVFSSWNYGLGSQMNFENFTVEKK